MVNINLIFSAMNFLIFLGMLVYFIISNKWDDIFGLIVMLMNLSSGLYNLIIANKEAGK